MLAVHQPGMHTHSLFIPGEPQAKFKPKVAKAQVFLQGVFCCTQVDMSMDICQEWQDVIQV